MTLKTPTFFASATIFTLVGCIEVTQPKPNDDVSVNEDTGETAEGDTTPTCSNEESCDSVSDDCNVGQCVNGRCKQVPRIGGTCQADGACGGGDGFCSKGLCVRETPDCAAENGDGCNLAVCGPAGQCVKAPLASGFCLAKRDAPAGRCKFAGDPTSMDPVDVCDNAGVCVERQAATLASNAFANRLVDGPWWAVMLNRTPLGLTTRAGLVDFDTDGDWDFDTYWSTSLADLNKNPRGTWCVDVHGGLSVSTDGVFGDLGKILHVGQIAPTSNAFSVLSVNTTDNLVVAIKPTMVSGGSVSGEFEVVWVRRDGGTGLDVHVGRGRIALGKLAGEIPMAGLGGSGFSLGKDGETALSEPDSDGLQVAQLTIVDPNGVETNRKFRGVMSDGGNIVLMVPEKPSGDGINDGLLMWVRRSSENTVGLSDGYWSTTQIAKPPGQPSAWLAIPALFGTFKGDIVSGLYGPSIDVWTTSEPNGYFRTGRLEGFASNIFVLNAVLGGTGRRWTGQAAEPQDFGFFVPSDPGAVVVADSPTTTPAFPGIGFIVKRTGP